MTLFEYVNLKHGMQSELASKMEISPVLIHQWAHGKRQVPAERCPVIQAATDRAVTCQELRPDVFGEPEQAA